MTKDWIFLWWLVTQPIYFQFEIIQSFTFSLGTLIIPTYAAGTYFSDVMYLWKLSLFHFVSCLLWCLDLKWALIKYQLFNSQPKISKGIFFIWLVCGNIPNFSSTKIYLLVCGNIISKRPSWLNAYTMRL